MENEFINARLESFKQKYPIFRSQKDYIVFTAMCIFYFYYTENDFDPDQTLRSIVDGANDGGIDAVINDPTSECNDLVIVQSKYYQAQGVPQDQIVGELSKINETINNLDKYKVELYKEEMIQAYRNAVANMEDNGQKRVVFFTSQDVNSRRTKNTIAKNVSGYFKNFEVELYFADDIQAQIELAENGKNVVEFDTLNIDRPGNVLQYENSIIVNVSAQSLQDLYARRRSSLLGLNLRYHIAGLKVDNAIEKTITNDPKNFWYKNNGILIVCQKYDLDGKILKLSNFSIVNGGQTTFKLGHTDLPAEDFYLQCKIVESKGVTQEESSKFISEIAEATNSQKPIKDKDLKANRPEQWELRSRLSNVGVYYMPKNGDRPNPPSKYPEKYNAAKLEQIGKLGLAGILQMPGTSRSNSSKMYDDQYYFSIFRDVPNVQILADLLKIDYYYNCYTKTSALNTYAPDTQSMIKNGRTFCLASIVLAIKLNAGCFKREDIYANISDTDEMKRILRKMDNVEKIIYNKLDDEKEVFYQYFGLFGEDVLAQCFDIAKEVAFQKDGKTIAPSDYLKSDSNYYKDIAKRFLSVYGTRKEITEVLNKIIIEIK